MASDNTHCVVMVTCSWRTVQPEISVIEEHNENIGVILVDKGMLEDHLPNRILAALKLCKEKLLHKCPQYDAVKLRKLRENREQLYRQVYRACDREHDHREKGFTFLVNETPMNNEDRRLSGGLLSQIQTNESNLQLGSSLISSTIAVDVHCDGKDEAPTETLVLGHGTMVDTNHLRPPDHELHQLIGSRREQKPKELALFIPLQTNRDNS